MVPPAEPNVTIAVILAAGGGSRYAGPTHKLLAPLRGRPVIAHAVEAALESGIGDVVVVTGAVDVSAALPEGTTILANPRWAEGQSTSLRVAVEHARERRAAAIVVGLGDQPGIPPSAWRAVAESGSPLAVATYGDKRRNPVRLAAEVWPDLPVDGDEGARSLLRSGRWPVERIACQGDPDDIDTVEDLTSWS